MRRIAVGATSLVAALVLGATWAPPALAAETHTVTVTVTTPDGTPIAAGSMVDDVAVTLFDGSASGKTAATDASGSVRFEDVPEGTFPIGAYTYIDPANYGSNGSVTVDGDESLTLVFRGLAAISGRVLDATTKVGVAGASVSASDPSGPAWGRQIASATGTYLMVVPASTYYLKARANPYTVSGNYGGASGPTLLTLTDHDVSGIDIPMTAPAVVTGKVTFRGAPVPHAEVQLLAADNDYTSASTTTAGNYAARLSPGPYAPQVVAGANSPYLTTYSGGHVRPQDAKRVTAKAGTSVTANISLVASAGVTGKVLNSQGKPVKNVIVTATNLERAGTSRVRTDAKGLYLVRGLATGTVKITYERADVSTRSATASVKQGTTTKAKSVVVKKFQYGSVTGRVSGIGLHTESPWLTLLDSKGRVVRNGPAGQYGAISLERVKVGTYRVVVDGTNVSKRVTVKAGKKNSIGTIVREKLNTLSGVVRSTSGKPIPYAKIRVTDVFGTRTPDTQTDKNGRFVVSTVVSGTYTVRAYAPDKSLASALVTTKVSAGKKKTGVTVTLPRAATLTGLVKNSQGKVVAGVTVRIGSRSATTNGTGRWTLTGLPAGKQTVNVRDPFVGGYHAAAKAASAVSGKTVTVATIVVR